MAKKSAPESWAVAPGPVRCPLCGRVVPKSQADKHHLVPLSKGGKHTVVMHRICHRQLHVLFSESELARSYSTLEALLAHPQVQAFVQWVQRKPEDFYTSMKRSSRLR